MKTAEEELKFMDDGIETIQTLYYESHTLPTGSVAVLADGRFLVTEAAWDIVLGAYNRELISKRKKGRTP